MSKMAGQKRHSESSSRNHSKKIKTGSNGVSSKPVKSTTSAAENDEFEDLDTADNNVGMQQPDRKDSRPRRASDRKTFEKKNLNFPSNGKDQNLSSKEAHQKQKVLKQERVAAKPNADSIARSKQLWERLRRKSHVEKEERQKLVTELFEIITGRVKDFVFKHDSVRVIQCALKYATPVQKKQIAEELRGHYRELAESRYAKFLIAKMVVGDNEIRDMVVPEFYGHVSRLIRHPEASWIMDDIYRTLATKEQKARLLSEWYGPEFAMFNKNRDVGDVKGDLSAILEESPAKRAPIMQYLKEMTNQLVQKKTTGFTMLHDAMLQYFLNCKLGSPEHNEFLEMLRDDEEGDCFRNLAFTKSGSQLVCLALAHGSSKDRRNIMRFFKTHMKLLAYDPNGYTVLLTAYEVIDDTVMTAKTVFPELLAKDLEQDARDQEIVAIATSPIARVPLIFPLTSNTSKWLTDDVHKATLETVREIRQTTSKKDPEARRTELVKAISQPLLDFVAAQTPVLVRSSLGCQFVVEVLLGGIGDKTAALEAIAVLADGSTETAELIQTAQVGRMLKTLVQGGRFDKETKTIQLLGSPLGFHNLLYQKLSERKDGLMSWATGSNAFTILAMLEAEDFGHTSELEGYLQSRKKELSSVPESDKSASVGAAHILRKIGADTSRKAGKEDSPVPDSTKKSSKGKSKKVK